MAHSLETRVPFLDNDLVDFAMSCPVNLKLNNLNEVLRINENQHGKKTNVYHQKTNDGKQILRDVMKLYVPSKITNAPKQGFSSPDSSWFKGESIDFVKDSINTKSSSDKLMNKDKIKSLVKEHLDGDKNRRLFIWSLLNFEEFLNVFKVN